MTTSPRRGRPSAVGVRQLIEILVVTMCAAVVAATVPPCTGVVAAVSAPGVRRSERLRRSPAIPGAAVCGPRGDSVVTSW